MQIFISWSKNKSKRIALEIKEFLEGLFHNSIRIWMSDQSIDYGEVSTLEISRALENSQKCIAILTNENYNSPWIMYEIGAIAGRSCFNDNNRCNTVIPILFEDVNHLELAQSPIGQFQRLVFQEESIKTLVEQINSEVSAFDIQKTLENQFKLNWGALNNKIQKILHEYLVRSTVPVTSEFLINELSKAQFPIPTGGNVIKYESGFETQKLYEILLSNADKRLWFWGRKNRKLFSPENREFFENLKRRQQNGFDFRCLFLNPRDNELVDNAQKGSNFLQRLLICIDDAKSLLGENHIEFGSSCKFYSCRRLEHIIIIDNTVLFSPIIYDDDNFPYPITKAPFFVVDLDSIIGQTYCEKFEFVWNNAAHPDDISIAI